MKRSLVPVVFSLTALSVLSANAQSNGDLVNKYHWGSFYFDGFKVKNTTSSAVNFDNTKRSVESKNAQGTYKMTWDHEDIENAKVLSVTEIRVTPLNSEISDVAARTSTFSGDKLRSSTLCYGNSQKGTLTKNAMKCVTATKRSCKRLLEAYAQQAKKAPAFKNVAATAKAAEECSSVLDGYATLAKAFGNQSAQVEKRHNDVINGDTSRIKSFVDRSTGSQAWDPTNIGSMTKSQELSEMATTFASSADGMRVLTSALEICMNANADMQDDGGGASAASSGSSSKNGRQ